MKRRLFIPLLLVIAVAVYLIYRSNERPSHLTPTANKVLLTFTNLPQPSSEDPQAICKNLGGPYKDKNANLIVQSCLNSAQELSLISAITACNNNNPAQPLGCSIVTIQEILLNEQTSLKIAESISNSLAPGLCHDGFLSSVSTTKNVIAASKKVLTDAKASDDTLTPQVRADLAYWQQDFQASFSLSSDQIVKQAKELKACAP